MATKFPYEQTKALTLEYLKDHRDGQFLSVLQGVVSLAIGKGMYTPRKPDAGRPSYERLDHDEREDVSERVRQTLWQLLIQGVIVFGLNDQTAMWPFYRVTEHGMKVVQGQGAQPYDPGNLMREFTRVNPSADPVIVDYLDEALRAFNHDCQKSTCVMIGAASEQAILLVHEAFENAIADTAKKAKFQKSYHWTIQSKYRALKAGLDALVAAKALPKDLAEAVSGELSGAFELIRRYRNESGHPEIVQRVDPDTNFLTLRVFTEYVRRLYQLIDYLKANPVKI